MDSYISYLPRFDKQGILVTICDTQIAVKRKASYDVIIMMPQLLCSYVRILKKRLIVFIVIMNEKE